MCLSRAHFAGTASGNNKYRWAKSVCVYIYFLKHKQPETHILLYILSLWALNVISVLPFPPCSLPPRSFGFGTCRVLVHLPLFLQDLLWLSFGNSHGERLRDYCTFQALSCLRNLMLVHATLAWCKNILFWGLFCSWETFFFWIWRSIRWK